MTGAPMPAALVVNADCARHDAGWGHPEHQGRLPAIVKALHDDTPALIDRLAQREAAPATRDALLRVHTSEHVDEVERLVAEAARVGSTIVVAGDTGISAASLGAALGGAGCAVDAVATVLGGGADTAFALTRPPGHHATRDRIMGFCLFNNVAVAARSAQADWGLERILIVDWDVHHGNGTQGIFYDDPGFFYLSLHQAPWYPGTGHPDETGAGAGVGTTRNVPLAAGTSRRAVRRAFTKALDDTLATFTPDLVLVSAGFDCLAGDPLGGLLLEPEDLHAMTLELLDLARGVAGGRLACVLEGGYAPARLGDGVLHVIRALAGLPVGD
jgi:acetoin utilization deacetylase AcuC-like enzyme